jgi:hypothetical protein
LIEEMSESDHQACVDAWLEARAKDLTAAELPQLFERAFTALWQRAHRTLGDVTLRAIMDRVLHTAVSRHPVVSFLKLEPGGLRFDASGIGSREGLTDGMRFLLVEFLTVLGNLTADILSPALQSELAAVTLPEAPSTRRAAAPRKIGEQKA